MVLEVGMLISASYSTLPLEIVVWIYDTFDENFGIENDFEKYLKEYSW